VTVLARNLQVGFMVHALNLKSVSSRFEMEIANGIERYAVADEGKEFAIINF